MIVLSIAIVALAGVLALPVVADVLALARQARASGRSMEPGPGPPRILFLVPAHDEEMLIERCVRSVQSLDYPPDCVGLTVVADNCTDDTALTVLRMGAGCLVRMDPAHPGKPMALAWAVERIALQQWDGIVVLDADSRLDAGYARALARHAPLEGKVVQGYNDVSNPEESHLTRLAAVFSSARCVGMNGMKDRAGLNVPLGNGYCVGSRVLRTHGWRAFSLSEDWELYALLTTAGVRIENEPAARVFSQEARTMRQSESQRKRWTAGKVAVLLDRLPALLTSRQIGWLQKLDATGELVAPGPVVLTTAATTMAAVAWALGLPGAGWIATICLLPVARVGLYTVTALARAPRPARAIRSFALLPAYAVWRTGIQLSAMAMGRSEWRRTGRHDERPVASR
jgi:cellulose synthase/poly-beta-1,6-N-acetylglucosamine synthase-like glycosyltransferase